MATDKEKRIMTRHPEGKTGVNITKSRYEQIKDAILMECADNGEVLFQDLMTGVNRRLKGSFDGKVGWYVVTVKLDLEARGLLERIPGRRLQTLQLTSKGKRQLE